MKSIVDRFLVRLATFEHNRALCLIDIDLKLITTLHAKGVQDILRDGHRLRVPPGGKLGCAMRLDHGYNIVTTMTSVNI